MCLRNVPKKFGTRPLSFWVILSGPAVLYVGPNLGQGSQTFWEHFLDPHVKFGLPDENFCQFTQVSIELLKIKVSVRLRVPACRKIAPK